MPPQLSSIDLSPALLLAAYASGYFPMAESRDAEELSWYSPEARGIIPLDGFHIPRSLRKFMRRCLFEIKIDTVFEKVIRGCAAQGSEKRRETWINDRIISLYCELARQGHAHSVECWHDGVLTGGLYGVSLGGAFFGESMFSLAPQASKVALVHLVERLKATGYTLLDTQYVNKHLQQFGVIEIPRADYLALLTNVLNASPNPSTRFRMVSDIKS